MRASERERGGLPGRSIGAKVPEDHYERLRWLAYRKHTTISAIVAAYVELCLNLEQDLRNYPGPPDRYGDFQRNEAVTEGPPSSEPGQETGE